MKAMLSVAALLAFTGLVVSSPLVLESGDGIHEKLGKMIHGQHEPDMADHLDAMADELELTTVQRKAVAKALNRNMERLHVRFTALMDAHALQAQAIHSPTFDEKKVRAASKGVSLAQEELAVGFAKLLHEVHDELSPDQLHTVHHLHSHGESGKAHPPHLDSIIHHVHGVGKAIKTWADRQ